MIDLKGTECWIPIDLEKKWRSTHALMLLQLLALVWLLWRASISIGVSQAVQTMGSRNHVNRPHLQLGQSFKISTWNCGGLSFSQLELCRSLNHNILALTETHDTGQLQKGTNFIAGLPAPENDPYAGVALLLSNRMARCVFFSNPYSPRIVYARIRAKP